MENELYILFLENRLKEVKLLHTNEVDEVDKLKAENEQLTQTIKYSNGNDGLYDEIVESNEYLEDQIKDLKAELSKFQSGNAKEYVDKLKADNVKLFKKLNDANKQIIAERVNR